MGIEKLKGSLLSEANKEAETIVASAEAHVRNMLDEEKAKGSATKAEAEKEVEKLLEEQRNERIAWARLETKRMMAEAREDAIKDVLEEFFSVLEGMRKSPEYKKFMKSSVEKAAAELGGRVTVHVVKGEKELVPKLKDATVVDDLQGLGGALVESGDGKTRINLTLETLFEAKRDDLRKQIYEKLFSEKAGRKEGGEA